MGRRKISEELLIPSEETVRIITRMKELSGGESDKVICDVMGVGPSYLSSMRVGNIRLKRSDVKSFSSHFNFAVPEILQVEKWSEESKAVFIRFPMKSFVKNSRVILENTPNDPLTIINQKDRSRFLVSAMLFLGIKDGRVFRGILSAVAEETFNGNGIIPSALSKALMRVGVFECKTLLKRYGLGEEALDL